MKINENAPPGKKILLLSLPFSKKIQFGIEDIHELASIISENEYGDGAIHKSKLMLKNTDINFSTSKKNDEYSKETKINEMTTDLRSNLGIIPQSDVLSFVDVIDHDEKNEQEKNENEKDISRIHFNKNEGNSENSSAQITESNIEASSTLTLTSNSNLNSNSNSNSSPNNMIRIPKLVSMFASRACRSSIMIGTALNKMEMKNVVQKLRGIEQPWNCPHGRPTVRHLIDLLHVHKKRKMLNINEGRIVRSRYLSYEPIL